MLMKKRHIFLPLSTLTIMLVLGTMPAISLAATKKPPVVTLGSITRQFNYCTPTRPHTSITVKQQAQIIDLAKKLNSVESQIDILKKKGKSTSYLEGQHEVYSHQYDDTV